MLSDIHVCVCVPSQGTWVADFGKSITLAFSYFAQHRVGQCRSQRLSLLTVSGSMLPFQRHELLKSSVQAGSTHTLFLDSDMSFPMDTINRLLERDKPVIAANCTTRAHPVVTTSAGMDGKKVISKGKTGVQEILHTGLAVFMLKTELVKKLIPPVFMQEWVPVLRAHCGEDIYFCHKLREEAGARIYVDHDLSIQVKHHGQAAFGHEDVCEALQASWNSENNIPTEVEKTPDEPTC